jgi:hypothetical protein
MDFDLPVLSPGFRPSPPAPELRTKGLGERERLVDGDDGERG